LRSILDENKLDGFIVTNPTNIFYLAGFRGVSPQERESILIFNPRATLVVPRLYQKEAQSLALTELKVKIVSERNQIFNLAKNLLKDAKRIGFEQNDLKFGEYQEFMSSLGSDPQGFQKGPTLKKLIPFKNLIEDLRVIKTPDEIKRIEKAQIISQKAFEQLVKILKVGQTEEEIAEKLAQIIKSAGGHGLAFDSIVASGPDSGRPHYVTGKRKIKSGDILLLDFGAKFKGYHADLSRTIFIGKPKTHQRNIYMHVLAAQKSAVAKITHGLKTSAAYHVANNYFKKQKLHNYFLHSLGHGVGLEVHEKPHLRPTQTWFVQGRQTGFEDEELKENMVFSVEPGLYFPWGGVRIEDLVVIKNGKAKVLGKLQEEIVEI